MKILLIVTGLLWAAVIGIALLTVPELKEKLADVEIPIPAVTSFFLELDQPLYLVVLVAVAAVLIGIPLLFKSLKLAIVGLAVAGVIFLLAFFGVIRPLWIE